MDALIFYAFALITVVSAGVVVFSKNLVRAVFSLLFTFFGVAGLYVFLHADFVAAVQVLVYIGGTLVLLLFGVMLTQRIKGVYLLPFEVASILLLAALVGGAFLARRRI